MSPEVQERIASYLGLELQEFLARYTVRKGKRVEMRTEAGHCIFYDEKESLCLIHPVKPRHCREWPLHPSIMKDRESFEIIRRTCPGFAKETTWEEVKEWIAKREDGRA